MSNARITIRPPPNVEFVQGYPGIPPAAHERPHAEVKGSIELRLGAQGVKAKWVRVELRKVETLPGGGQANTFYDFVGPSPVKVWEADGEWSWLHNQDFPFSIRIPESIPPSIALDRGAGIKYELIATLCMKGKKGILRKPTTPTLSTMTPIIIDKHELHSTWPVYAQPESRHVVEDLLTLTVDRTHTCYGPGDRVKVNVIFRNDGVTVAALRAFEFLLKETIIYRAGPQVAGKKGAPQVHVSPIGEQKVPVNATIYGGQQHKAELGCFIPQTHTTTTVNAARHIDIAYSLNVKAVLASGKPLMMELPVTVSNWPRNMSIEAVRRIGPSPNLSLITPVQMHAAAAQRLQPNNMARPGSSGGNQAAAYSTVPGRLGGFQMHSHPINERVASHPGAANPISAASLPTKAYGNATPASRPGYDEFGYSLTGNQGGAGRYSSAIDESPTDARRRPQVNTNTANRLTVANMTHDPEPDTPPAEVAMAAAPSGSFMTAAQEKQMLRNAQAAMNSEPSGSASNAQTTSPAQPPAPSQAPKRNASLQPRTVWPTAEEEKQRLFETARQQAMKTQASMGNYVSPPPSQGPPSNSSRPVVAAAAATGSLESPPPLKQSPPAATPAPVRVATASGSMESPPAAPKRSSPWPTAEEEKLRLFTDAQNAARRTQAQALAEEESTPGGSTAGIYKPPATSSVQPIDSPRRTGTQPRPAEAKSAGAQLYQHAISSMSRTPSTQAVPVAQPTTPPTPPASKPKEPPSASRGRFPTAEEEKAALRYYEAKRAVDRHQHSGGYRQGSTSSIPAEEPIAYDALYPAESSSGQAGSSHVINGYSPTSSLDNEGAGGSGQGPSNSLSNGDGTFLPDVSPPGSPSPPPPPAASSSLIGSAAAEKERLRRRYAAEDAGASMAGPPPSPPPRASSNSPPSYGGPPAPRSQPLPPIAMSGPRHLTAAEEKARLRAQYEAEEAGAASFSAGPSASYSYDSPPPPLPASSSMVSSSSFVGTPSRATSISYGSPGQSSLGRMMSMSSATNIPPPPMQMASLAQSAEEFVSPQPPPPLAPRPPVEYIQETQEEDARTQAEDRVVSSIEATLSGDVLPKPNADDSRIDFGLSFRPFSPLNLDISNIDGFDRGNKASPAHTPEPPPPLPPKIPVSY